MIVFDSSSGHSKSIAIPIGCLAGLMSTNEGRQQIMRLQELSETAELYFVPPPEYNRSSSSGISYARTLLNKFVKFLRVVVSRK